MYLFTTLSFTLIICQSTAYTQVREVEPEEQARPAQSNFASRLWYGGNVGLGFSSSSFESLFQIGVSPMVGYKIFEQFSIGPRGSVTYSAYRQKFTNVVQKANTITWSIGAFARYKIIRNIFAHAEYEIENRPFYVTDVNGGLDVVRRERTNTYVGGGYNSGERFGYEIMVLYNVNQANNDVESPFDIRVGFTYNF